MRKAVIKRIRVTPNGKLLRRHAGQNHFNAKASRRSQLRASGLHGIHATVARKLKNYF